MGPEKIQDLQNDLKVVDFIGENYRPKIALESNLIHTDILKKYKTKDNIKDLTRYQRGTFIIQNP